MKEFNVKIFDRLWVEKETLPNNIIRNKIAFSQAINWWQGRLNLWLNIPYNSDRIEKQDFIRIEVFDEFFPNWKIIYTGFVKNITRNYEASENSINIICYWLWSLLTKFYYNDTWYTFTKTDTASNILTWIINYFNSVYPWNWLDTSWIDTTVWNISIEFDYNNCFEAIENVVEATDKYFKIMPDWKVVFTDNPVTVNHEITSQLELQSLSIQEDLDKVINRAIVTYDTGTEIVEDTTSITNNELKEKQYRKTDIKDSATAIAFWNNILDNFKNPKQKVTLEVNSRYPIENIEVWQSIKVLNLEYEINNVQIKKIEYNTDIIIIELDEFDSIEKILTTN